MIDKKLGVLIGLLVCMFGANAFANDNQEVLEIESQIKDYLYKNNKCAANLWANPAVQAYMLVGLRISKLTIEKTPNQNRQDVTASFVDDYSIEQTVKVVNCNSGSLLTDVLPAPSTP